MAALGRPAYITAGRGRDLGPDRSVEDLRARTALVLDAAYEAGVRYLDCARSYGLSERFLAAWLQSRPRVTDVTIASKWGYRYVGDWRADADVHEVKDHTVEAFTAQLAETRAELGNRLDAYQIHSLTPESPALTDATLHRRLAGLREDNMRVGFSTSGPRQGEAIRRALDLSVDGQPLFTLVQSTWNLLETSAGPALGDAADAGLTVVIKEALANGRLAPGTRDTHPAVGAASRVASQLGVPLDQLALAAALHQSWASRVLSGAVTPEQVTSNAASESVLIPD
ncbi:MAG TPA: aldo/keto reductase, partial [Intrasporangium sp.]|uniref:aldo/keto reductase n=1 Tax=Intrasporangium sp. TaxID=1925024 RepID=UPI002D781DA0